MLIAFWIMLLSWCLPAIAPFALWNDDIWTAVLIRYCSLKDLFAIAPPLSLGFFAMQKFDVLIATQSNFSMMASRLTSFDMVFCPVHHIGKFPKFSIDRVQVISKKSAWFPYELNVIMKEDK